MNTNFKRIIAVFLLTALALTGSISAFAVAEEVNQITNETVNSEEVFEEEIVVVPDEEIVVAGMDEAVNEVNMILTEDGALELTEDGETELPEDGEAFEEIEETDLGELTGEAEEEAEPQIEEQDNQQLMADLIGMAVEEYKGDGIYGALNATFPSRIILAVGDRYSS